MALVRVWGAVSHIDFVFEEGKGGKRIWGADSDGDMEINFYALSAFFAFDKNLKIKKGNDTLLSNKYIMKLCWEQVWVRLWVQQIMQQKK